MLIQSNKHVIVQKIKEEIDAGQLLNQKVILGQAWLVEFANAAAKFLWIKCSTNNLGWRAWLGRLCYWPKIMKYN